MWHCLHLLLHAVQQSLDISCMPGPQPQTHSSGMQDDGMDKQKDAWQLHRPFSAHYAGSAIEVLGRLEAHRKYETNL